MPPHPTVPMEESHPPLAESGRAERIRTAFRRNAHALSLRPARGRGTASTTVRVADGLRCEVEDGAWRLETDLSPRAGGGGTAPDPGVLGRAALGSCLAVGYVQWAAHRGVPIRRLTVEVEADYDARGELGVEGGSPLYSEIRCVVYVESDAPERELCDVLREAEEHSPWWRMLREPTRVVRETWISGSAEETG